jgi:hypothetical protein
MAVAVYILTTQGLARIERIEREAAPQSAICLQRTTRILPVSADYDAFVRPPSGVIERAFGPFAAGAFRLDVAAEIGGGDSWQLGVFLAHALKAEGRLAQAPGAGEEAWCCTGAVDTDLNVQPVSHIAEKLAAAAAELAALAGRVRLKLVLPRANAAALDPRERPPGAEVVALARTAEIVRTAGARRPRRTPRRAILGMIAAAAAIWALAWVATERERGSDNLPSRAGFVTEANAPFALAVRGLYAEAGQTCASVGLGAAHVRAAGVAAADTETRIAMTDDLCGIELEAMPAAVPAYVAARMFPVAGKFARRAAWPREWDGQAAVAGAVRWRALLPRRFEAPIAYDLVFGVAAAPLARPTPRAGEDAAQAFADRLRAQGALVVTYRHTVARP